MSSSRIGRGADLVILDDPVTPHQANVRKLREKANLIYDTEIAQRLSRQTGGKVILLMQRLHKRDPSGHFLARPHGSAALILPAVAEKDEVWK